MMAFLLHLFCRQHCSCHARSPLNFGLWILHKKLSKTKKDNHAHLQKRFNALQKMIKTYIKPAQDALLFI